MMDDRAACEVGDTLEDVKSLVEERIDPLLILLNSYDSIHPISDTALISLCEGVATRLQEFSDQIIAAITQTDTKHG